MGNKTFHTITVEEKLKIIKDHQENHLSIRACATKYGIAKTSLVMWLRSYRENGIDGLESQIGKHRGPNKGRPIGSCKPKTTVEELQRENLKLQIEIERLKKVILRKELVSKRNSFL